jgi:23S rRNA (adenine2030-N6)-methyltransferase
MNYRHAFHAGNFADCFKHALLVWMVRALTRKAAPIHVLDTHAGLGRYDLEDVPAQRTGEWRDGIGRLLAAAHPPEPLADYLRLVRELGLYPGSPALIRALLLPGDHLTGDHLTCCELHPDDAAALRRAFAADRLVSVHRRDAWEALGALLPPKERRGLVLIDPPYEDTAECGKVVAGLVTAHARFSTAVLAAWYPIKHRLIPRALHDGVRAAGIRDVVAAELLLREPLDAARLNGCGLLVVNPPHPFEAAMPPLLDALLAGLSQGESGASARIIRIADE